MNRRALAMIVIGVGVVGVAAVGVVLTQSLRPSQRAVNYFEKPLLPLGSYQTINSLSRGRGVRLYIVRTADDRLFSYEVDIRDNKVIMPDRHWGWCGYYCADFHPGDTADKITATAEFYCHDPEMPESWASKWRWALDGSLKLRDPRLPIEDMPKVKIERSGEYMRIYRPPHWYLPE